MRPIERIDNFLENVDWIQLGIKWGVDLYNIDKSTEFDTSLYNNIKRIGKKTQINVSVKYLLI